MSAPGKDLMWEQEGFAAGWFYEVWFSINIISNLDVDIKSFQVYFGVNLSHLARFNDFFELLFFFFFW